MRSIAWWLLAVVIAAQEPGPAQEPVIVGTPPVAAPSPPGPPEGAVGGSVFVADPLRKPYTGMVYLQIDIDLSYAAAHWPSTLMVVGVNAKGGEFRLPYSPQLRTIRRAFIPGRSTALVNLPVPSIPGGRLGGDLVLEQKRDLKVVLGQALDARTKNPIPWARFFFDDRDHRGLNEQIAQRPEIRPGVVMRLTSPTGEIILPSDEDPFLDPGPINISFFHPEYIATSVPVRSQLRRALREPATQPLVFLLESGATITGRVGTRNALGGAEPAHVRLLRIDGAERQEVKVYLDEAGNFGAHGLPPGRYQVKLAHGSEEIAARAGETYRLDRP